jgi:predicted DNA-binding helix-hairpin-helix protein
MIVGAAGESDKDILDTAMSLYGNFGLKRVYYSGYVPISDDKRLPGRHEVVPLVRENRLYQADWLVRVYGFGANEILNDGFTQLDLEIDPKLSWALRNLDQFPVDINTADLRLIMRVPGIGVQTAKRIVAARRFQRLDWEHLSKLGAAVNRAKFFVAMKLGDLSPGDWSAEKIRKAIMTGMHSKWARKNNQLSLF